MDRIIEVKVGGSYLSKDNKNAGVRGEANVTKLRIAFDEGWDGYAKKVTFWDARGGNPVERTLTTDLLEDITKSTRIYLVPIPAEPMAEAGTLTFVIDGYIDGKRQRSIADSLEVKDSPIADNAGEPADPSPTQAEQLQKQIDGVLGDVRDAVIAKEAIENMSVSAETLETDVPAFVEKTEQNGIINLHYGLPKGDTGLSAYEIAVKNGYKGSETEWNESVNKARVESEEYAKQAQAAVGKTSYIGENGNWYAWDGVKGEFYDTGVKAQSGSTVYCGDNPPPEADVWIDPSYDGTEDVLTQSKDYTDEKFNAVEEQTTILQSDVDGLKAQINEEAHFRGYLSTNAKIQALEATPNDFAYSAESGTKWVYDAQSGWIDTGNPVPDQLTPASETTPLINGTASVGTENAYARGDHRHPTDTTRASIEDLNNLKTEMQGEIKEKTARLIRKITVEEDVTEITISTDEEGNPFSLNDFEIRFTGKHSTTMWLSVGKGEKYFCVASIANNNGLPVYNRTTDYFVQNAVAHYTYTGTNFCGVRYNQEIGPIVDGKYTAGAGENAPFNTTPVSPDVSKITIKAISGGIINAGSIIEVWGY